MNSRSLQSPSSVDIRWKNRGKKGKNKTNFEDRWCQDGHQTKAHEQWCGRGELVENLTYIGEYSTQFGYKLLFWFCIFPNKELEEDLAFPSKV